MCTLTNSHGGGPFAPGGCQVPVGAGVCGETRTLDIVNEFKRLYEEKMQEIDKNGAGECLQEKFRLQQEWIGDLTEQNELLVRAVEELEREATERVKLLEQKLQQSAQCICEVENKILEKEGTINTLQAKIDYVYSFGDIEILSKELKTKIEECDSLKQAMVDMRQALTEEVASKHDTILQLKRDCQDLEDRCIQADKQTAFRDDIIKELRKEIKHLKQQVYIPEKPFQNSHHENLVQKSSSGEPYLVVNHSKKIVHSGKSTIIYLRHESEEKDRKNANKKVLSRYEQCLYEEKKTDVAKSKENPEIEDLERLQLCKSENNLCLMRNEQNIPRPRSKVTGTLLNRYNTFITNTTSESRYDNSKKNISVPNHIPVKMYVNNIEVNKKQF